MRSRPHSFDDVDCSIELGVKQTLSPQVALDHHSHSNPIARVTLTIVIYVTLSTRIVVLVTSQGEGQIVHFPEKRKGQAALQKQMAAPFFNYVVLG